MPPLGMPLRTEREAWGHRRASPYKTARELKKHLPLMALQKKNRSFIRDSFENFEDNVEVPVSFPVPAPSSFFLSDCLLLNVIVFLYFAETMSLKYT